MAEEHSPLGNRRVFVGNLAWSTTWRELKAHFREAGNVLSADVALQGKRSRGWGTVEFATPEAAQLAIEKLNGSILDARQIQVRFDERVEPRRPQATPPINPVVGGPAAVPAEPELEVARRVYVGNLAWRTSWQDLKDYFKQMGNVVYSDVIRDEDGRSKGFGIVEFEKHEDAARAIRELNETRLAGRVIFVRADKKDRDLSPNA